MSVTKTIEVDREKIISIINHVLNSDVGTEIFVPCSSKKEQKDMHTCIVRELKVLSNIDPADAASITHRAIFRDGRFWIALVHVDPALNSIFVKTRDGRISKIGV